MFSRAYRVLGNIRVKAFIIAIEKEN